MKTLCTMLLLTMSFAVTSAQNVDTSRAEIALGYTYIHSNAPPSGCGCFSWNGGVASASVLLGQKWAVTAEFAGTHANPIGATAISPTMLTFLAGPKYRLTHGSHRASPFADILIGVAQAQDGYFPNGTASASSATAFAMTAGGGLDFSLGRHLSFRPFEADYLLTHFPNGVNGRQNNFRISSGLVFRLGQR